MAADFVIDVGFNTSELAAATGGGVGGGGGASNQRGVDTVAKGVKGGLLQAGFQKFIGILTAVISPIGFLVGILGTFLVLFIQWAIPFFRDWERNTLRFSIFIVNSIIGALERVTNSLVSIVERVTGTDLSLLKIEFPRFQEEIILEAFDILKEVESNAKSTAEAIESAQKLYKDSFIKSLLTTEDFEALKTANEESKDSWFETFKEFNTLSEVASFAGTKIKDAIDAAADAFVAGIEGKDFDIKAPTTRPGETALEATRRIFNEQTNQNSGGTPR